MSAQRSLDVSIDPAQVDEMLARSRELVELLDDIEDQHAGVLARTAGIDPELTAEGLRAARKAVLRCRTGVAEAARAELGDRALADSILRDALATLASTMAWVLAARALAERSLDAQLASALEEEAAAWSDAADTLSTPIAGQRPRAGSPARAR